MKSLIASAALALLASGPALPQWTVTQRTDPMTDIVFHQAITENPDGSYLKFECISRGFQTIYFSSGEFLPVRSDGMTLITYRADDHLADANRWWTSYQAPVARAHAYYTGEILAGMLMAERRILIQDGNNTLTEFDGSGMSEAVGQAWASCGLN